jgi:predicted secreted Zn-dependent protease
MAACMRSLAPAIVTFVIASAALADSASFRSKVITYPVTGKTAKDIHDNIRKVSPKIARNATYAFSIPSVKIDKSHKKTKSSCSFGRYSTRLHFAYVVPKLTTKSGLAPGVAAKWNSFAAYLLEHEKTHGAMWRSCLSAHDAEVRQLSAKTCESLDKKRERMFEAAKKKCVAADEKFDFQFRKEVLKHPFVAEALKAKKDKD